MQQTQKEWDKLHGSQYEVEMATQADNETGSNKARASLPLEPCRHCSRPLEQHWSGNEGAFCAASDFPDEYKLFGPAISDKRYEARSPSPSTTLPPRTRTQVQWALLCDRVINEALPGSLPAITTLMLEGQRLIVQAETDAAIEAVGNHGRYGR